MDVLILIVMEERIGLDIDGNEIETSVSLNPYCNGRKNRITTNVINVSTTSIVLILIVMEERIGSSLSAEQRKAMFVLILIVMEERIGCNFRECKPSVC